MLNKFKFRTPSLNTLKRKANYSFKLVITAILALMIGIFNEPVVLAQQQYDTDLYFNLDNEIVWYDDRCVASGTSGSVKLSGKDTLEKILNFYMSKGMSLFQAAAIAGNYQQESQFDPEILNEIGAYGLAQWLGDRKDNLMKKQDHGSVETQLEFSWEELQGPEKAAYDAFMAYSGSNIGDLAVVFGERYERYGTNEEGNRRQYAQEIYDQYKDAEPLGGSISMPDGETVIDGNTAYNDRMPTIALDPGHSKIMIEDIDEETGVKMADYSNGQEDRDVFEVSLRVKTMLEEEGYNVVMLKDTIDERVNYRERIGRAEHAGAVMGISIHTSPNANEVYNQFVGGHRYDPSNPSNRHEFSNSGTATLSTQYSEAMAEGRSEIEGTNVVVKKNNFNGRAGIWGGDLPVISLLSDEVPWVYNEFGGSNSGGGNGISEEEIQLYAEGIVNGVKKSGIEATPGGVDSCGNAKGTGAGAGFEATLLGYAWPDPISNGDTNATDTYKTEVIGKARENGRYIGGISHPGIDCGGFATSLLIDSGFEPNYNYGGDINGGAGPTGTQEKWLAENWEKLPSGIPDAADLPQGAVAVQPGHIFIFVGDVDGFNSDVASASLDSRAPAAGGNSITESANWYVKK